MNRLFLSLLTSLIIIPVQAQDKPPPVPDVPPPVMMPLDESMEPQVTIVKREGKTIEEHRVNGKLYKIVVTSEDGSSYTLIDKKGDGAFSPVYPDTQGAPNLSVPMWVIGTF